jgi:hypothetical protein
MRALPMEVWADYLLPLLPYQAAARLACTCKALREVVRERFPGDVGNSSLALWELQAALTTFPRLRTLKLCGSLARQKIGVYGGRVEAIQREALVQWLRGGGYGKEITTMATDPDYPWTNAFIHAALWEGALPSLTDVSTDLASKDDRAVLTGGLLGGIHELRLRVSDKTAGLAPQLAALGLVRQLPALTTLELSTHLEVAIQDDSVPWPPFIPPSLKALCLRIENDSSCVSLLEVLRILPGMLGAGGARLESLEVHITSGLEAMRGGLVHLAQVLRCCSPTLKSLLLPWERYPSTSRQRR